MTSQHFINSTLEFKEDFISYCISDEAIESSCINSNKTEDIVK